jgi:protease secretion system membrane fusion protein
MSNQKLSKQLSAQVEDAQVARSGDENALRASADTQGIARKGLWVLALGFGGFLLWASLAPLDEGVPTMGTVAIDTKRKAVQHLSGGIVKEVLVREGDEVKADQVLMRLDSAVSRANFESIRQRYVGLSAVQSRLQAEQRGLKQITFQSEVLEAMSDPEILAQVNNQRQLFDSRRKALQAELQSMDESMKGLQAQRESAQHLGRFSAV